MKKLIFYKQKILEKSELGILIKVITMVILFSFFYSFANSQTFDEWARIINAKNKNMDNVKVNISVKALDRNDNQEIYSSNVLLMRKGNQFYYKMDQVEIINDGMHQLTLNHDFKVANYLKVEKTADQYQPDLMSMDSILSLYDNPVKLKENEDIVQYKLTQESSLIREIFVSIDKEKEQVEMIAYNYDMEPDNEEEPKNRVEMYFYSTPLTDSDDQYFVLEKYLKEEEDKLLLKNQYSNYQLETIN